MYVAFWTILVKTIGFIFLYLKGKKLDSSFKSEVSSPQKKKIYPNQQARYESSSNIFDNFNIDGNLNQ